MDIFDILSLFGGLALFLYGMRIMGDGLKTGTGGTLKNILEKMTNNLLKAFLLGVLVTALIQSSTATIVITSGLVAAGLITLRQSLGIIIGANVGTTVTGQIIRLLDLDNSSVQWLQIFKPSTLAPVALIIGVIFVLFIGSEKTKTAGTIALGFGILFTGLLNMTASVSSLTDAGVFDGIFAGLDHSPVLGYLSGAGVAFLLQSSSATIGILQAFSMSGALTFRGIYAVIMGVYLGDCVTTAIVCSIGARPEARRVGLVNILYNLCKTLLVLIAVTVVHRLGLLDAIWAAPINSGGIANANTVFNLGCALLLFPVATLFEKLSRIIIREKPAPANRYEDKLEALDPNFYNTPVLAFRSAYNALSTMLKAARSNITKAFDLLFDYDAGVMKEVNEEEDNIDLFADRVTNYLVEFSPKISLEEHVQIQNQYYKNISEFERLGDHAQNIAEYAQQLNESGNSFSADAKREILLLEDLIDKILDHAELAFMNRDVLAAKKIEPMEEVVDDMINALRDNHLARLRSGLCNMVVDNIFLNLLSDIERISDTCSNVGISIIARVQPQLAAQAHEYSSRLHQGSDMDFNEEYEKVHAHYFRLLESYQDESGENVLLTPAMAVQEAGTPAGQARPDVSEALEKEGPEAEGPKAE